METLAQSVSTIAPTATPAATVPLVFALAGNGTWFAYFLATAAILLVAWCVGRFARYSSSPGSLYSYAAMILPPWVSSIAAWSLLLAYVATASSVIGGLYQYAIIFVGKSGIHPAAAIVISLLVTGASVWIAWRDVKISARLMLWIEASSVFMIITLVMLVLVRHGSHVDSDQLHLRGMKGSGLRLGLVLALFSFVGFESATTLGAEARDPLRTIPRAVIQSSILGGAFFTVCAYTEVLGFRAAGLDLGASQAPMHVLATQGGLPLLGRLIDIGLLVSLSAGTLACITAAARVLLLMAHNGLAHDFLRGTHERHETPHRAIVITGIAAVLPVIDSRGARRRRVETFTAGWVRSPRMALSSPTGWFRLPCRAICAVTMRFVGERRSFPGWRFARCCWRWPAISTRSRKVRTGSCRLFISAYLIAGMIWFCRGRERRRKAAGIFRAVLGIGLGEQKQHDSLDGEHAERGVLAVPGFRLPHQKPFASDAQKRHEPHEQS